MPKGIPIEYDDVEYPSLLALAKEKGVSYSLLQSRLKQGWTLRAAIETGVLQNYAHGDVTKTIKSDGVVYSYRTMEELAQLVNIPLDTIYYRMRKGMSLEAAISAKRWYNKHTGIAVEYDGIVYPSMRSLVDSLEISLSGLRHRMRNGLSLEEAVSECLKSKGFKGGRAKPVDHDGVVYPSLRVLCETRGLNYYTVNYRLTHGWSLRDALETPVRLNSSVNSDAIRKICCRKSIRSAHLVCDNKYVLIKCAVCGRSVMLNFADACSFEHSGMCEQFEWQEG